MRLHLAHGNRNPAPLVPQQRHRPAAVRGRPTHPRRTVLGADLRTRRGWWPPVLAQSAKDVFRREIRVVGCKASWRPHREEYFRPSSAPGHSFRTSEPRPTGSPPGSTGTGTWSAPVSDGLRTRCRRGRRSAPGRHSRRGRGLGAAKRRRYGGQPPRHLAEAVARRYPPVRIGWSHLKRSGHGRAAAYLACGEPPPPGWLPASIDVPSLLFPSRRCAGLPRTDPSGPQFLAERGGVTCGSPCSAASAAISSATRGTLSPR